MLKNKTWGQADASWVVTPQDTPKDTTHDNAHGNAHDVVQDREHAFDKMHQQMTELMIKAVDIHDILKLCFGIENIMVSERQGISAHPVIIVSKQKTPAFVSSGIIFANYTSQSF